MPVVGLEPTTPCEEQFLRLPRIPFRHTGWCRATATDAEAPLQCTLFAPASQAILHAGIATVPFSEIIQKEVYCLGYRTLDIEQRG